MPSLLLLFIDSFLFIMTFDTYEDESIFTILGIAEEGEDETENPYVNEDTKTLKEYGY